MPIIPQNIATINDNFRKNLTGKRVSIDKNISKLVITSDTPLQLMYSLYSAVENSSKIIELPNFIGHRNCGQINHGKHAHFWRIYYRTKSNYLLAKLDSRHPSWLYREMVISSNIMPDSSPNIGGVFL